ncbi:MAG: peptidoglycan-binding domain-containing protein [Methyloceanibacter sp.]
MAAGRAQVIERGVQGGVVGAIIGGLVGGGRGVGTGGAAEADANARARAAYESEYYGEPPLPGGPGLVHDIQAFLVRLGYNPGPVDGVYGQRTADAISQYQYASRLSVDGRPSPQLLNFMISQGPGSGRAGHPDEHLGRQRRTMREASAKPAGCQSVS